MYVQYNMICVATKTMDHDVESQKGAASQVWLKKEVHTLSVLKDDS